MALTLLACQVTLVVGAGLCLAQLLRRRAAALRQLVLLTALVAGALVPLGSVLLPDALTMPLAPASAAAVEVAVAWTSPVEAVGHARPPVEEQTAPVGTLLVVIWAAGTVLGCVRIGLDLRTLTHLRRRSSPLTDHRWEAAVRSQCDRMALTRRVTVRLAPEETPLVSWGCLRPQILVPASALGWDDASVRAAVCHEVAHIARNDWLRFIVADLVRSLYWWHPLVRMATRQSRHLAERACDDVVLGQHVEPAQYAELLVSLATAGRRSHSTLALGIAPTSLLERRIAAMLDTTIDRSPLTLRARCLGVAPMLALCLLVASASMRAGATNGTLAATVRPDGGQPLADVAVVLTSAGHADVEVQTDANGSFTVDLAPGSYRATVRVPGFKRFETRVDVEAGERIDREFGLVLGSVTETVFVAGETDPEAVPVQLGPDRVVPQIGVVTVPRRIDAKRALAYPTELRQAGIEGVVKASGRVGTDGHVDNVQIVESPHPGLSAVVTQYVTAMRYEPTKVQGTPRSTDIVVTVQFHAPR